jgi:hypothetical protein
VALPGRIADTLGALGAQAIEPLRRLFARVGDAVEFIGSGIRWLRDNAGKAIKLVVDAVEGPLGVLGAAFERISNALFSIRRLIDYILDKPAEVASAVGKIAGAAGAIGGIVGKIPGLASGGPVTAGSAYVVGEHGPELFLPATSGTIIANDALRAASPATGGGGWNLNLYVQGDFVGDRVWVERWAEKLAPALQRVTAASYELRV